jgi:hypothetical protein
MTNEKCRGDREKRQAMAKNMHVIRWMAGRKDETRWLRKEGTQVRKKKVVWREERAT